MAKKLFAIYKEEYDVFLVEVENKIYRIEVYFKVSPVRVQSETSRKKQPPKFITKVTGIECSEVFMLPQKGGK